MEQEDYYDEQLQDPTSNDEWIEVTPNINKKSKVYNRNFIQLIPHTANRFELLSKLKEESVTLTTSNKKEESPNIGNLQEKLRKTQLVKSLKKEKQNIGDGKARKCATLLQDNLGINYKVSSFIKPGAQMNEITKTAREEIETLKCKDVVILWEGTNDISRNNMNEALRYVSNFVNKNKEVNILLIKSPHRHDLILSLCLTV
jgi:hypothetical protein